MIELDIPGRGVVQLSHLVLDFNGTLALDGALMDGVAQRLTRVAGVVRVHVVTADTFGKAAAELEGIDCTVTVLEPENQTAAKKRYVDALGAGGVVAMGNGRNDRDMVKAAQVGVVTVLGEGAAVETLVAADVVCTSILDGLDLLLHPLRLKASLRA